MANKKKTDATADVLLLIFLLIFAMPIAGIYLICSDESSRPLGLILTVVGIILWIIIWA